MRRLSSFVLCSGLVLFGKDLQAEPLVFGSFESETEVNAVSVSSGAQASRSSRFPAWASQSLEISLPDGGGWIEYRQLPEDWNRHQSLLLYAWSDEPVTVSLEVRDSESAAAAREFSLAPGANHLQYRLQEMPGLNLRKMAALRLSTAVSARLWLDYLALDRFHPVLEERGRWDVDYTLEVETPHVAWGRPLAGGPVRTFALAPVADGRGIVELAQRLALDLTVVTIGRSPGTNKWGFGDFYEHRSPGGEFWDSAYSLAHAYMATDLLYGPPFDLLIWPGLHPWESYPQAIRDAVVRRVREGAGLVLINPVSRGTEAEFAELSPLSPQPGESSPASERDSERLDRSRWQTTGQDPGHFIVRGVPLDAFPWGRFGVAPLQARGRILLESERGNPVLAVRELGKGRIVALAWPETGLIPSIDNIWSLDLNYPYQEYFWSLVSRAAVWAANREPTAGIEELRVSDSILEIDLRGSGALLLDVTIQTRTGERVFSRASAVPRGSRTVTVPLEGVREGGLHFLNVRLLRDDSVVDWAARVMNRPQPVRIVSLSPEGDQFALDQKIEAAVVLNAPAPIEGELSVQLLDNYGRLLDRNSMEVSIAGETDFAVPLETAGALTHLARLEAWIETDGRVSDRASSRVFIRQPRRWDDYEIVMYRFGPDPVPGTWPAIDRQLQRLHVTGLAAYSLAHSRHANYAVQAQTRISGQESPDGPRRNYYSQMKKRYLETRDKSVLVREHCLNDPSYWQLVRGELESKVPSWSPLSPLSYYVYEEPSLTCYGDAVDLCFSPFCMTALRQWLAERYESLAALNRQWSTDFLDWAEVLPDDTYEARQRGNYASWADHRTFMEVTYQRSFQRVLAELRRLDPDGILLNSGTQISGSHNGCDYSRINRFVEHLNAYTGGNQLDFHRNFNPAVKISGGAGYGILGRDVLYDFYGNLFKGADAGAYIFWEYSTLTPDLRLCQSGRDMEQGFRELRGEGIGKLVSQAVPDNHGIAIHYSYPSIHGAWIVDGEIKEEVSYHTSRTFDRFNENRDGWVKALRDAGLQFDFIAYSEVEAGGLLEKGFRVFILPMSVALSDREVAAIRAFVEQGGVVIADALPGLMDEHCTFRKPYSLTDLFGASVGAPGPETIVGVSSQPSHEGFERRLGQGAVYLLGHLLDEYPRLREEGRHERLLDRLGGVLEKAGVSPQVELRFDDPAGNRGIARYLYQNGSTRLLGILPDHEPAGWRRSRLLLQESAVVYDVRRHREIGTGTEFELDLQSSVPELLALLPERIRGLETADELVVRSGETVEFEFEVQGVQGFHSVARVRVVDPSGNEVRYYGGNCEIADSRGTVRFRTALNDARGQWTIEIREVISGRQKIVSLEVE